MFVKPYRIVLLATLLAAAPAIAVAQTLNLLTEDAYPFQYLEKQQLTGMAVEIVNEIFKRAGVARKDELMSWKNAYDRAQTHANTCIYSTSRTEDRERLFKWIGPIVQNKWAAFAKKGFKDTVSKASDFKQYRVGVLKGDAKERFLKELPVTFLVSDSDDAAIPAKLSLNRKEPDKIDLWVTGYYTGAHVAAKTGIKDVFPVLTFQTSENYLACHPGLAQATVDKLQRAFDAMKRDGAHAAIVARYEAKTKTQ